MVLAGAVKQNPMALAERIAAALAGRELSAATIAAAASPSRRRGRAFSISGSTPAVWHAQLARDPARRHRLWRFDDRAAASGSMSNTSRPTRPGRCMSATAAARWSATRWRRCSPRPGFAVAPRVLHQRCRRPGRCARALAASALPRGAGRDDRRDPRGALSRRISDRDRRRRSPRATARNGSAGRRRSGCRPVARVRRRRDDGADPRRSRRARRRHDVFVSERALVDARRGRRGARGARRARADLYRRARAAQGQAARRLGAAAADPVPRDPVRRRCRPAAEEVRRLVDLFRRRHRLSPRQVPPRLRQSDRRLGRRSRRLRQAHAGGGARR